MKKTSKKKKSTGSKLPNINSVYERVVKDIYKQLESGFTVKHNERIMGTISQTKRQIDVTIRQNQDENKNLKIVECKNMTRKIGINTIDSFSAVMKDVGATRGILVSKAGFTKTAINYGQRLDIDCCQIHDGESKDWRLLIKIPILIQVVVPQPKVQISISSKIDTTFFESDLSTYVQSTIFKEFVKQWEDGKLPIEDNVTNLPLTFDYPNLQVKNGDMLSVESILVSYTIKSTWRLGYVDELPKTKLISSVTTKSGRGIMSLADLQGNIESFLEFDTYESLPENIKNANNSYLTGKPPLALEYVIFKGFRKE